MGKKIYTSRYIKMTVINGIEISDIDYKHNDIKFAIKNNDPIEDKLNVIIVISNVCLFARRYILLNEFVKRIKEEEDRVNLYIVELIYPGQQFVVTKPHDKNHLQIKTEVPLWHKENMINLAVQKLLPSDYKAFAWVDADIEFENDSWALDTLKILNGCKDVIQLFSHAVDMDKDQTTLNLFHGVGYSYSKNKAYTVKGKDYWHPGYAWAMTRKAYEKLDGIYADGVLGSGDSVMALSFLQKVNHLQNSKYHADYNNSMTAYQAKAKGLRLGYTPGVIRHHYHGTKQNRQYTERWQILMHHQFSPVDHLTYDAQGILVPTPKFTAEFQADILKYFWERKEDD